MDSVLIFCNQEELSLVFTETKGHRDLGPAGGVDRPPPACIVCGLRPTEDEVEEKEVWLQVNLCIFD